jgi:hypothetical protein
MAPMTALLNKWYIQPTSMLSERTTLATIAIMGIRPPSSVGAFIICIMIPKTTPPTRPATMPLLMSECMIIPPLLRYL